MDDNPALAQKALDLLQSGRLPARQPDRIWGGASSGTNRCYRALESLKKGT